MKRLASFMLIALLLSGVRAAAQDPNFGILYSAPHMLNPAMAGLVEGTVRFNATHRARKANEDISYQTSILSIDYPINLSALKGGTGLQIYNDQAGAMRTTNVHGTFAYDVPLGVKTRYNHLRAGFQVGFLQRSLDPNRFTFEDQFRVNGFSGNTSEPFSTLSQFDLDVSVGLLWYRTQKIKGNPEFNYYAGVALHHLNRPEVSFFNSDAENITPRITLQAGGKLRTRTPFDLNVSLLWMLQNRVGQLTAMLYGRYVMYENNIWFSTEKMAFTAGASFRTNESVTPFIGFEYMRRAVFAFGYDILTNQDLTNITRYNGFQVMLSYTIGPDKYAQPALPFPKY